MTSVLKLNEDTKNLIMEVSALSGIPQNVVKEVWEYYLVYASLKVTDNPDGYACITVPYVGKIFVKYDGDIITPSGDLSTNVDSIVEIDPAFKKLVGDINDEGITEITDMLVKKIEASVLCASNTVDSGV